MHQVKLCLQVKCQTRWWEPKLSISWLMFAFTNTAEIGEEFVYLSKTPKVVQRNKFWCSSPALSGRTKQREKPPGLTGALQGQTEPICWGSLWDRLEQGHCASLQTPFLPSEVPRKKLNHPVYQQQLEKILNLLIQLNGNWNLIYWNFWNV